MKRAAESRGLRVFTPERLRRSPTRRARSERTRSSSRRTERSCRRCCSTPFRSRSTCIRRCCRSTAARRRCSRRFATGATETGVTIIAMDAGMDTGDVLLQERTPIGPRRDVRRAARPPRARAVRSSRVEARRPLRERNARAHAAARARARARRSPMTRSRATLTRPLRKDDLAIDWAQPPRCRRRSRSVARRRRRRATRRW